MTRHSFDKSFNERLRDKTVKDLMNFSGMNTFHPIVSHGTFEDVLRALAVGGVHRVCMLDGDGRFGRLVTQSEVIRFISHHLDDFGDILDTSLLAAGLVRFGAVTAKSEDTLEHAFAKIVESRVSAVPIVDHHEKVIGTISVRDIRRVIARLLHPSISIGKASIESFLEETRADRVQRDVISCTAEDSVRNAVTKLQSNKVHRVYILNDDRLIGVVSLTDVIAYLLHKKIEHESEKWEDYVKKHIASPKVQPGRENTEESESSSGKSSRPSQADSSTNE